MRTPWSQLEGVHPHLCAVNEPMEEESNPQCHCYRYRYLTHLCPSCKSTTLSLGMYSFELRPNVIHSGSPSWSKYMVWRISYIPLASCPKPKTHPFNSCLEPGVADDGPSEKELGKVLVPEGVRMGSFETCSDELSASRRPYWRGVGLMRQCLFEHDTKQRRRYWNRHERWNQLS
jgi:hypothetical protein